MDFSPEAIRAHFHDLTAEKARICEELDPLREELNALVAGDTDLSVKAAIARETVVRSRIKELQTELYPIEQERGACARALEGQTGEPPSAS